MSTSTWTNSDTESACRIWAEYQRDHDVSGLIGQVAGIDPVNAERLVRRIGGGNRQTEARGRLGLSILFRARRLRLLSPQGRPPVIVGTVTPEGMPVIDLVIAGSSWPAIIDTGFNGDLELPAQLQPYMNARFLCRNRSLLAAGQIVEEDSYLVDFPFDGLTQVAEASFVSGSEVLIGTHLLRQYSLLIEFPARTLQLTRIFP